jgi:hypothetical protein
MDNATVRLAPQDDSITSKGWHQKHNGNFEPTKSNGKLNVTFYGEYNQYDDAARSIDSALSRLGQRLQWFGSGNYKDVNLTLDGLPINSSLFAPSDKGDSTSPVFDIGLHDGNNLTTHVLGVSAHPGKLSLDHLMMTSGNPSVVNPLIQTPQSSGPSKGVIAGSIVGGCLGLISLVVAVFLIFRWRRKRLLRETWKDSALPSVIEYPASRVSTRSSFSREVVTGDIEYNPEAQKKMDALSDQTLAEPPAAVILHADSGVRIRLRSSEVPPRYTQI